jgi:hypothetical protein
MKKWQELPEIYMKANTDLWLYLAELFLEW